MNAEILNLITSSVEMKKSVFDGGSNPACVNNEIL
ncbi:uncharacterized protein METZ01_LOCUS489311, partial [marine metagenome]